MRALRSQRRGESDEARLMRLAELLRQAPAGKLDDKVIHLLTQLPPEEVRKALVELIKRTSEDAFAEIKSVYLKHFGNSFH